MNYVQQKQRVKKCVVEEKSENAETEEIELVDKLFLFQEEFQQVDVVKHSEWHQLSIVELEKDMQELEYVFLFVGEGIQVNIQKSFVFLVDGVAGNSQFIFQLEVGDLSLQVFAQLMLKFFDLHRSLDDGSQIQSE